MSEDAAGRAAMADKDCGSGRWEKNNLTWQWALDEMVVNVARRSEVQWPLVLRRAMAFYLNVQRCGGAGGDGGRRLVQSWRDKKKGVTMHF